MDEPGKSNVEVLTAIQLFAGFCRITPIRIADEREAFGPTRISILCQKDSGDAAPSLEDLSEVALFCEFRDLYRVSPTYSGQIRGMGPSSRL